MSKDSMVEWMKSESLEIHIERLRIRLGELEAENESIIQRATESTKNALEHIDKLEAELEAAEKEIGRQVNIRGVIEDERDALVEAVRDWSTHQLAIDSFHSPEDEWEAKHQREVIFKRGQAMDKALTLLPKEKAS